MSGKGGEISIEVLLVVKFVFFTSLYSKYKKKSKQFVLFSV